MIRAGMRHQRRAVTFVLALVGVLALPAAPVAGYTVLSHTGTPGPYQVVDTSSSPGGTCHYGHANAHGVAALDSIRGRVPQVHPKGSHAQTVSWQIVVQRQASTGSPWSTVAASPIQKATASPGTGGAAPFSPIKVLYAAPYDQSVVRALYRIRWYSTTPNHAVTGLVTLWITDYLAVWPASVGSTGYVFDAGTCWSSTD